MGNASAIYNLLRNLGGSFGVAFVTTIIARRGQFHQAHLVEHLAPFDRAYQIASHQAAAALQLKGMPAVSAARAADATIYGQLLRQSSMVAFNDAFHLLSMMLLGILPLILLMRQAGSGDASQAGMH
jgi:DHA2 family multidrug resistance protein